jgi:hypothetical protein
MTIQEHMARAILNDIERHAAELGPRTARVDEARRARLGLFRRHARRSLAGDVATPAGMRPSMA